MLMVYYCHENHRLLWNHKSCCWRADDNISKYLQVAFIFLFQINEKLVLIDLKIRLHIAFLMTMNQEVISCYGATIR